MKVQIVYNQHGKVLAATLAGDGADKLLAAEGEKVAEFALPETIKDARNVQAYFKALNVDVERNKLHLDASLAGRDTQAGHEASHAPAPEQRSATLVPGHIELFYGNDTVIGPNSTRQIFAQDVVVTSGYAALTIMVPSAVNPNITLVETRIQRMQGAGPYFRYTVRNDNPSESATIRRCTLRMS